MFGHAQLFFIHRCLRRTLSHVDSILALKWRSIDMISLCCTLPAPDFQDLSLEESKIFCRQVYLLRKRGYSIADAQAITYRRVLAESIAHEPGSAP